MPLFAHTAYTPDSCNILPIFCISVGRCASNDCNRVHGCQFVCGWLWWAGALTVSGGVEE